MSLVWEQNNIADRNGKYIHNHNVAILEKSHRFRILLISLTTVLQYLGLRNMFSYHLHTIVTKKSDVLTADVLIAVTYYENICEQLWIE